MGVDRDAEISVLFTDNENIRELNREHRGIDRTTDVLSFPMYEFDQDGEMIDEYGEYGLGDENDVEDESGADDSSDKNGLSYESGEYDVEADEENEEYGELFEDELCLGDIVISLERAAEQAKEYGTVSAGSRFFDRALNAASFGIRPYDAGGRERDVRISEEDNGEAGDKQSNVEIRD